ncbi:MAG TPA: hypothetical protein VGS57_19530 [Thermoanaerobaculia bacterium]|jgi:hypothetical protein|nr:hypothetical protein [Thermoanaerobaculia bacterium]
MHNVRLLAALAPLVLLAGSSPPADEGPREVVVTNFPETQKISGAVTVERPVPMTRLVTVKALVTPGGPANVADLTEGSAVDASGFASATLSLAVEVQGSLAGPGKVGAMLVPDQSDVLAALRSYGIVQFPLTVEAPVAPSPAGIHQSSSETKRLGFPKYRVFFYNTSPRTSEATLYVYLANS